MKERGEGRIMDKEGDIENEFTEGTKQRERKRKRTEVNSVYPDAVVLNS